MITNTINGNVIYTYSTTGVSSGNTVSFTYNTDNVPILNDELGNSAHPLLVTLTVSDSVNEIVGTFANFKAALPLNSSLTASNSTPDVGQPITFNANILGGFYVYTYNLTVVNSSGAVVGTGLVKSTNLYATFSYTPGADAVGTDNAHVLVTDNATVPTNETLSTSITVSSATYVPPSTTTVPSGSSGSSGGGGGGGSGGTGGSAVPTVTTSSQGSGSCDTIFNFSQDNAETLNILGNTFNVTENYITPTTAGITVSGTEYELGLDQTISMGTINGVAYNITLLNLSYLPIQDTITVSICGSVPPANSSSNVATTTVVPTTTVMPTTTVVPTTTIKGYTPPASANYVLVLIIIVIAGILVILYYFYGKKGK